MSFPPDFRIPALGSWDPGGQGQEALGRRGPGPSSTELTMIVTYFLLLCGAGQLLSVIVSYVGSC